MSALAPAMPTMPLEIILVNSKTLIFMVAKWAGKIVLPLGILFIRAQ